MSKIYEIWYHSTIDQEGRLVQAFYSKELALEELNRLNNQFPHSSFYSLKEVIVADRGYGCVFDYLLDVMIRFKESNKSMDLETKCFIQDVQIVELNEQLAQCRAENDKLKAKLKRVQSVLDDKRVIYED